MPIFAHEAIQFAIDKEQEAADFYLDLAKRVNREEIREELTKFAKVELGHKKKLQSVDLDKAEFVPPQQDLQIANYLVKKEPSDDMSYEDIIQIAMERELASQRLYKDLASLATEEGVRAIFEKLAIEEANHKHYFETIWDEQVLLEN